MVNLLKIDKKKSEEKSISEEVNDNVMDHVMSGIDLISGKKGNNMLKTKLENFDETYFKPFFCIKNPENEMLKVFEKLALS